MSFAPGTLVKARGREWVVLPESEDDFLVVRPLGGTIQETAGIHSVLESVTPATFGRLPPSRRAGEFRRKRLVMEFTFLGPRTCHR